MSPRERLLGSFQALFKPSPDRRLTLLLSGGGDSVALFHLLRQSAMTFDCLHFQHDSPGQSFAAGSRAFCERLCAEHRVKLEVVPIQAQPHMKTGGVSWEAAAHRLRYQEVARRSGLFLTAHTADDQAETVIMRLIEGAGLSGLAGIHKSRREEGVERPLLGFRRSWLREYLEDIGEEWLEDPSNLDGNDRAKVRHQILPVMEKLRPSLVSSLGRSAHQLQEDEHALTTMARDWMRQHGQTDHWPLPEMQALLPALRFRVLREIWRGASRGGERSSGGTLRHADSLVMTSGDNSHLAFPNRTSLCKVGRWLWLAPSLELPPLWSVDIPKDLRTPLGGSAWLLVPPGCAEVGEGFRLPLPAGVFRDKEQYQVRARRPEDEYRGRRLKKYLASKCGQPPWIRDRWPLLTRDSEVLGIPGLDSGEGEGEGCLFFSPQRWRWAPQKDEVNA